MLFKGHLYFYPCLPLLPWIKLCFAHQEDYRSLVYLIPRTPLNVCFLQLARVFFFQIYFQSCSLPSSLSLKLLPTPIFKFQWLPLLLEESCTHCLPVRLPPAPTSSSQGSPSSLSAVRTTVLPSAVICLLQLSPLQGLLFFTSPCSLILLMAQGSFSTSIPQEDIPNLPLIHLQRPVLCQHPSQL